jgi:hypothetical protein
MLHREHRRVRSNLAFHVSRVVIGAGLLIVMVAMNLPFVTVSGGTLRDAMSADALPVLLLLAPVFLATLIPDHTRPLPDVIAWPALGLAAVALPLAVVKYLGAANLAATLGGGVGFGARLLVFGALVVATGVALGLALSILGVPVSTHRGRPVPSRAGRSAGRAAPQTPPHARRRPETGRD